ncbi:inositol monophosphatase family protein, partial [Nonomuraea sp. NPDC001684]
MAVEAAQAAGALLAAGTRGAVGIRAKGEAGDVVTDLDLASEKLLVERILTAFPSHTIVAEESGLIGAAGGEWTWLVDPLDGTNNVAIGLPTYVVGVALCRAGRPVLGVVHDPVTAQTWSAIRGRGAVASTGARLA